MIHVRKKYSFWEICIFVFSRNFLDWTIIYTNDGFQSGIYFPKMSFFALIERLFFFLSHFLYFDNISKLELLIECIASYLFLFSTISRDAFCGGGVNITNLEFLVLYLYILLRGR